MHCFVPDSSTSLNIVFIFFGDIACYHRGGKAGKGDQSRVRNMSEGNPYADGLDVARSLSGL